MSRNDEHPTVAVVTSAHLSRADDLEIRQRRYVISQSTRIACVLLATMLPVPLAVKGLLLAGAIALPWFGVVMANGGPTVERKRRRAVLHTPPVVPVSRLAVTSGRVIDAER